MELSEKVSTEQLNQKYNKILQTDWSSASTMSNLCLLLQCVEPEAKKKPAQKLGTRQGGAPKQYGRPAKPQLLNYVLISQCKNMTG